MRARILALGAAALLVAAGASAQRATGGIRGTVVDQQQRPLPGVTVTLTSPNLMGERVAVSDAGGAFAFRLLPPGNYDVRFSLSGFQTVEQNNVRVGLETTPTLEVSMREAFAEEVVVSSDAPIVDTTSTTTGTTFGSEMIERIPTGRTFESVTFLATGAVEGGGQRNEEIEGNPSIMGASAVENRYIVDELDTTDPAFGYAGTSIPLNFVEEIQVKTGGYEAEFGGAMGGVINMVTKSGGNEFSGEVFGFFTNDELWSDPEIPEGRGDARTLDQEYDVGVGLGGKIIQDRLWFYLAYNPMERDQRIVKDVFLRGEEDAPGELLRTNDFIRSHSRDYYTAKLSFQPSSQHTFTANLLADPVDIENDFYSTFYVDATDPTVPTDQFYSIHERGGTNFGLNWNGIFSDTFLAEARYGHHESKDEYGYNIDFPNYQDQTTDGRWTNGVGQDSLFGGPGFQQPLDERTRDQARLSATFFAGDHEIKGGVQYFDNEYNINYNMVGASDPFCSPLADPSYGVDINQTGVGFFVAPANCDSNGDGSLDGYELPGRVGNRWRLRDNYYYNRNYKNASEGQTEEMAIYLQDSWRVTDYFTVNLGVRAESAEAQGNGDNPNAKLDFSFDDQISPRLGFIWDFARNGRSRLYAHYGRFYESVPLDINVRAFGREAYDFYFYDYPESGLPNTENAGGLWYILHSGPADVDPNIKPSYLEEVVFGADYEILRDMAVGTKFIYRSIGEIIEDISVDGGANYFITNPGGTYTENPVLGTPLDEPAFFPEPSRYYRAVELSLTKRYSNNWQGFASVLWSELEGNYEGLYSRDNQQLDPNITSKFDIPEILIGARGPLPNDREWQFKSHGAYSFPFGLNTGMTLTYLTGTPVNRLGAHSSYGLDERFVVPRGTAGRTPDLYWMDLHVGYPLTMGGVQLEFILDVFNLFDQQKALEVDQRWTVMDETEGDEQTNLNWGEPLVYQYPRNARLGLRLSF